MAKTVCSHTFTNGTVLEILQGDITLEKVDAIVNAANEHLLHGGGVAGAILRRGGDIIQRESSGWVKANGRVTHDRPAVTNAGNLPCQYVIHAVGPVWGTGNEDARLAQTVCGTLETAEKLQVSSIAFPAISTGIYGFPKERAAKIFSNTFETFFQKPGKIQLVRLVLFDEATCQTFLQVYQKRNDCQKETP